MGYTKYSFDRNYFKEINTEEKAYWLGFIAADGCVSAKMNSIRVDLKSADVGHLVLAAISQLLLHIEVLLVI